jgi:hypothetical protein
MISKKKILVVFFLILFIQLGTYWYLHERANWITPPDHVHAIASYESNYPDFIRQSKLGAWALRDSWTTLPSPRIYTYLFYIAAGKITAMFNIDPVLMYELLRITGSIAVFTATYWLITLLLPITLHVPALVFTMLFETGPTWDSVLHLPLWQWTTTYFISPLLGRNFYIAHHLWAEALGLVLLSVIIRSIQKPSRFDALFVTVLTIAGCLTNPTYSTILVSCVFLPWILYALVTKTLKRTLIPIAFTVAAFVCVGLFTMSQFSSGPPWNTVTLTEKAWWTTREILLSYFQSYSLFFPFIALLYILAFFTWKQWSQSVRRTFILCTSWSFLPIILIILAKLPWTPMINGRIETDLTVVPFGILSALVFYAGGKITWLRISVKHLVNVLFIIVLGASLLLSVVYIQQTIQKQDVDVSSGTYSWVRYPTLDLWNGVMALKNVPVWSHIMDCPTISMIIPEYVPVRVYQTITSEGTDWTSRRQLSYLFFRGDMPRANLRKLFTDNAISYVFYGPEEATVTKTTTFYPDILTPIFTNPEVTIYKVLPMKE